MKGGYPLMRQNARDIGKWKEVGIEQESVLHPESTQKARFWPMSALLIDERAFDR